MLNNTERILKELGWTVKIDQYWEHKRYPNKIYSRWSAVDMELERDYRGVVEVLAKFAKVEQQGCESLQPTLIHTY
jgi:hypothetical protein